MKNISAKSNIKPRFLVDEAIADFNWSTISHEDGLEIISNFPESALSPEIYAELHPEDATIKKHNK